MSNSRTWVVSHWDMQALVAHEAVPAGDVEGDHHAVARAMWSTSEPTSSTTPIGSWPRMSPGSMNGPSTSYRCRSEPQMPGRGHPDDGVGGMLDRGVGHRVHAHVVVPCQVTAFMDPRSSGDPPRLPGGGGAKPRFGRLRARTYGLIHAPSPPSRVPGRQDPRGTRAIRFGLPARAERGRHHRPDRRLPDAAGRRGRAGPGGGRRRLRRTAPPTSRGPPAPRSMRRRTCAPSSGRCAARATRCGER